MLPIFLGAVLIGMDLVLFCKKHQKNNPINGLASANYAVAESFSV
ncbi:hypothetical protein LMIV_0041 [Listeria monocytogenes FSL J1-208]|nr:hypothetical protein LMIV_0041 [Listeria monocytogenes FSL J1-208]